MQNPTWLSIATKNLLYVASWVSIVILLSTALAFWQFRFSTEALARSAVQGVVFTIRIPCKR